MLIIKSTLPSIKLAYINRNNIGVGLNSMIFDCIHKRKPEHNLKLLTALQSSRLHSKKINSVAV
jgi:hypothetical protein